MTYDLPQALLAVISDADFTDPAVMDRRRRDHERIDNVLSSRVEAEHDELTATGGATMLDRLLDPLNRWDPDDSCARHARRSGTTP